MNSEYQTPPIQTLMKGGMGYCPSTLSVSKKKHSPVRNQSQSISIKSLKITSLKHTKFAAKVHVNSEK